MGTSSSHRSPATAEWEYVRELYRQPSPDPGQVVGRIVDALDPATRVDMAGPGVATCLGTLVTASHSVHRLGLASVLTDLGVGTEPATLQLAAGLRRRAQDEVIAASAASRFSELAIDALGVTAMEAAAGDQAAQLLALPLQQAQRHFGSYAAEGRLHKLAGAFIGYDFDRVFRYFVSRDLSDFVGSDAFPHVGLAQQFLDRIGLHCRRVADGMNLSSAEPFLQESVAPDAHRSPAMVDFTAGSLDLGLNLFSGSSTPHPDERDSRGADR
jgi:hypothetical protein